MSYIITRATEKDMPFLMDLANKEGWNPGLDDAGSFFAADPSGFYIGHLSGERISCISAVAYNDTFGFIGLYIVLPEFRGKGYGIKIWEHAIAYMGKRSIGLDGVVAQQKNYQKSGFQFFYNNARFKGVLEGASGIDLLPIQELPFQMVLEYDTSIFGVERSRFLEAWIKLPHSYSLAKISNGCIAGYGVVRKCQEGYKIGPLFADTPAIAKELLLALAQRANGEVLFFDVIQTNAEALALAEELGMTEVFQTARMYKGIPPHQNLSKIFGVTSFELG